jgi:hypothetical protein
MHILCAISSQVVVGTIGSANRASSILEAHPALLGAGAKLLWGIRLEAFPWSGVRLPAKIIVTQQPRIVQVRPVDASEYLGKHPTMVERRQTECSLRDLAPAVRMSLPSVTHDPRVSKTECQRAEPMPCATPRRNAPRL